MTAMYKLTFLSILIVSALAKSVPKKIGVPRFSGSTASVSVRQTTSTVTCTLQASGSGLTGKGIHVTVVQPKYNCDCGSSASITKSANFVGGTNAQMYFNLPSNNAGLCFRYIRIKATFPYNCKAHSRTIYGAIWGNGVSPLGSCRVLRQRCGSTISNAAVPYFDMWCKRPGPSGQPEKMKLVWSSFGACVDKC